MDPARLFLTLGALFLLGLATDMLGRRTMLPRVTLLVAMGFLLGPSGAGLIEDPGGRWFPIVADMALVMVGFLLGGALTRAQLREHGRLILIVSMSKALGAFIVVLVGLLLLGTRIEAALLFAGIASSTDPAATLDVVRERHAEGPFAKSLLGIVALDDVWGLFLFSIALAVVESMVSDGGSSALVHGIRDVGGAILIGVAIGVPTALLTGRIEAGEPTQAEALAAVCLCAGLALWLDVSFLLAAMVLGAVVANLARHHTRPFHAIEGIEWPFMILFFTLAGASIDLRTLATVQGAVIAYIGLRAIGTMLGTWLGVRTSRDGLAARGLGGWMGASLMPQAGVAIGMALVATQRLPEVGAAVLPVAIASTAIFELVGPVLTRLALDRADRPAA
jgi:Kef-type K+ transport system membrane component KefB